MSSQRVDKVWQQKGLKDYPMEALLGTLGHYGIPMNEEEFRKLADTAFPLGIAQAWRQKWKGTGPFKDFVVAAAVELWRRWLPDRVSPQEVTEGLAGLMGSLARLLNGDKAAPVAEAFDRMSSLRGRMPLDGAVPQERFLREALAPFTEKDAEIFDSLAETLAGAGQMEHAEAFSDLEEFLLPDRRGISKAMVRAAKGEKEAAENDLATLSADTTRTPIARLLAVDGLIHLKAHLRASVAGKALLASAEEAKDLHLALDLLPRLEHIYKALGDREALFELMNTQQRLEAEHDKVHPGHRRHRH